jgi:iron complex transport system substrate-binding protein
LILAEDDTGPPIVLEQLRKTGVEIAVVPEQMDGLGIIAKVECVARIIGASKNSLTEAKTALLQDLETLKDLQNAGLKNTPAQTVAVILGLDNGQPTVGGSATSAHSVLQMAGATNAFASLKGWKPVPAESMLQTNPDIVILPNRAVQMAGGLDKILSMQSIRLTNAGVKQRVITMDGMALLGFGPRTLGIAIDIAKEYQRIDPGAE